jgi:hypothetical protein
MKVFLEVILRRASTPDGCESVRDARYAGVPSLKGIIIVLLANGETAVPKVVVPIDGRPAVDF